MQKGLSAYIFKHDGLSYSANGISANFNEVVVLDIGLELYPSEKHLPRVKLVKGNQDNQVIARPVDADGKVKTGGMFGGCYISTSDSRLSELARKITGFNYYGAIPLHDRFE